MCLLLKMKKLKKYFLCLLSLTSALTSAHTLEKRTKNDVIALEKRTKYNIIVLEKRTKGILL